MMVPQIGFFVCGTCTLVQNKTHDIEKELGIELLPHG